jgi:hypothetical protein
MLHKTRADTAVAAKLPSIRNPHDRPIATGCTDGRTMQQRCSGTTNIGFFDLTQRQLQFGGQLCNPPTAPPQQMLSQHFRQRVGHHYTPSKLYKIDNIYRWKAGFFAFVH